MVWYRGWVEKASDQDLNYVKRGKKCFLIDDHTQETIFD